MRKNPAMKTRGRTWPRTSGGEVVMGGVDINKALKVGDRVVVPCTRDSCGGMFFAAMGFYYQCALIFRRDSNP